MSLLRRRGAHQDPPETSDGEQDQADSPSWALLPTGETGRDEADASRSRPPTPEEPGYDGQASDAEELLSHPAVDDDLGRMLAARPRPAKLPSSTAMLSAAALLVVGFAGGVLVQRHDTTGTGFSAAAFAARAAARSSGEAGASGSPSGSATGTRATGAAGPGAGGFGGFGGAGGGATVGTVKLVDGTTLYVQTSGGGITKVSTNPTTTVRITKDGTLKDLTPGTDVVVIGTAGSDGTVTARTVTEGGLGGGRGQAGG